MNTNEIARALTFLTLAAFGAPAAAEISWWYGDVSYQTTSDNDADGYDAEISGHIRRNWVLQGRVNSLKLEEDAADVTQTQFDLIVGRVFRMSPKLDVMVGGGYTYVDYDADLDLAGVNIEESADLVNVQVAVRAELLRRLEAEGKFGILFDDVDASDLLWEGALRYHLGTNLAVHMGVRGSEENYSYDDVVYELGFRFDLNEPR